MAGCGTTSGQRGGDRQERAPLAGRRGSMCCWGIWKAARGSRRAELETDSNAARTACHKRHTHTLTHAHMYAHTHTHLIIPGMQVRVVNSAAREQGRTGTPADRTMPTGRWGGRREGRWRAGGHGPSRQAGRPAAGKQAARGAPQPGAGRRACSVQGVRGQAVPYMVPCMVPSHTVAGGLAEGARDLGQQRGLAHGGESHQPHPGIAHCSTSGTGGKV